MKYQVEDLLFHCYNCNRNFATAISLKTHIGTKHPENSSLKPKTYECDFDGKVIQTKSNLFNHMRTHLPKVKCEICGLMLKIGSVDGHLKSVHAEKSKFQCKICSKFFKTKYLLKTHDLVHDKKFQCEVCNMKFAQNNQLSKHAANAHEKPGNYQCEICDKKFNGKYNLKNHQIMHLKNRSKSLKCQQCDYSTYRNSYLERHQIAHEKMNKKIAAMKDPQNCKLCATICKSKHALIMHIQKVHPKIVFQCDLCGIYLKIRQSLIVHINSHLRKMNLQK